MPCVRTEIDGQNQAVLSVVVLPPGKWREIAAREGQVSEQDAYPCSALIDTGANRSCISKHVADALGIKPRGRAPIRGVHGMKESNLYTVDFILWDVRHFIGDIDLVEVDFPKKNKYEALIGMDVISRGTLHTSYHSQDSRGVCTFCI